MYLQDRDLSPVLESDRCERLNPNLQVVSAKSEQKIEETHQVAYIRISIWSGESFNYTPSLYVH